MQEELTVGEGGSTELGYSGVSVGDGGERLSLRRGEAETESSPPGTREWAGTVRCQRPEGLGHPCAHSSLPQDASPRSAVR